VKSFSKLISKIGAINNFEFYSIITISFSNDYVKSLANFTETLVIKRFFYQCDFLIEKARRLYLKNRKLDI
jgi:hypothetical protein